MQKQNGQEIRDAIAGMSSAEKLELIASLAQSLRNDDPVVTKSDLEVAKKRQATFQRLQERLATITIGRDPYAHLGHGDRAHDQVLYDQDQK